MYATEVAGERISIDRQKTAGSFVILGVLGASFSAIFVRFADAPSTVLVFYRLLISTVLLTPFFLNQLKFRDHGLRLKDFVLCVASGIFLGIHFTAYFEALRYTSITSAVVLVDTEIFFVALAMFVLWKEKITKLGWIGIAVALFGSLVIAFSDAGQSKAALTGDLIALAGAASMAVYTVIGRVCRKTLSTIVYTFLVYLSGAVTVLLFLVVRGIPLMGYSPVNYLSGLGMAVICTILGHSVFSWSLKYVQPSFVATTKLLEPVFAAVLGLVIFFEKPSVPVAIGGLIVISGVFWFVRKGK